MLRFEDLSSITAGTTRLSEKSLWNLTDWFSNRQDGDWMRIWKKYSNLSDVSRFFEARVLDPVIPDWTKPMIGLKSEVVFARVQARGRNGRKIAKESAVDKDNGAERQALYFLLALRHASEAFENLPFDELTKVFGIVMAYPKMAWADVHAVKDNDVDLELLRSL